MKNILSTWICLDDESNASYFPSVKAMSSDQKTQNIYWRCLAICMFSARKFNPTLHLAVFSNITQLPVVDGVDYKILFKKLNVNFYSTPFEYQTPDGYYQGWKNQFYEFSIFKFISDHPDFDLRDNFCLIDSDCIISGELTELFNDITKYGSIEYLISYREDQVINGNSRLDMKEIFSSILERNIPIVPNYFAGEFFGARINVVKQINIQFDLIWTKLMHLHNLELPRLHEEAHVLSLLYFMLNLENDHANKYIKRLWTDPTSMRNVVNGDENLKIWHLPSEKRNGFNKAFHFVKDYDFDCNSLSDTLLIDTLKTFCSIPQITLSRNIYYFFKGIGKKILK